VNSYRGELYVLLGNGDGSFAPADYYDAGGNAHSVVVGDMNSDGDLDLVVATGGGSWGSEVFVFPGNGDGTFGESVAHNSAWGPRSAAVGDLNGDGDLDVATANWNSGTASVFLGNGDGTLATGAHYGAGSGSDPNAVAAGDLDGDGDLDVAVPKYYSDNMGVLLGNGDGTFGAAVSYYTGDGPNSAELRDFDGDWDLDLAVANAYSDDVSILQNLLNPASPVEGCFFASLSARDNVTLRWTVESLAGIEGLNVYRATSPDGPFARVNETVIAPSSPGFFEDPTVWPETTFWYQLRALLADGREDLVGPAAVSVTTGGRLAVRLSAAHPNPFTRGTSLSFDVPDHVGPVSLRVYNARGQLVKTLAEGTLDRGRHLAHWDGRNTQGMSVPSGVYFMRLEVDGIARTAKALLAR